ncbi:hypothetical protein [Candidatus Mycoplasma haematohominis]|uniref:Uncharacterized protein n=1 Tax=Candidatus Mycoplasma haematohominis TaxID=1494318 RepID=A0A478FV52_9MOLU|nr:hypothetical protein [Candidatus Mycoplasma haemohominis]GCE63920.1 hypothetical protein MHSWG343_09270 [Candidatus Mycoplasma haemohominis]
MTKEIAGATVGLAIGGGLGINYLSVPEEENEDLKKLDQQLSDLKETNEELKKENENKNKKLNEDQEVFNNKFSPLCRMVENGDQHIDHASLILKTILPESKIFIEEKGKNKECKIETTFS